MYKVNNKLKNHLHYILDYYNLKYKLNCGLCFEEDDENGTYHSGDLVRNKSHINYSISQLRGIMSIIKHRFNFKNELGYYVAVLLHEIKHCIDFKSGLLIWEKTNLCLLIVNLEHAELSWEIRADNFANEEILKWI